jgi:hypothetical protein
VSDFWFPHQVRVRPLLGAGGMHESHGPEVSAAAEVKDKTELIRDADGSQTVSSSQVTVPLDTVAPVGSFVTVWPGTPSERKSRVIATSRNENDPDLDSFQILYLK